MGLDENLFFREATLRLCSSLDIEVALQRCHEYIGRFMPVMQMSLHILDFEQNVLRVVAMVGANLPDGREQVLHLPEKGRREAKAYWKTGAVVRIINQPDQIKLNPELLSRLGLDENISYMSMVLELEGSQLGEVGLIAQGLEQYSAEHARLLHLLREPLSIAMSNALQYQEILRYKQMLADDNKYLLDELRSMAGDEIIGADFGLSMVMRLVEQVAPLDSPVLLLGETGTGKELIANAVHRSSPRKEGPFIKVNCGAIPETLLDSELFGHEKGAFTGAISQSRGRFERADRGTIFLDEIGELPPQAQVRLLHVLQRKEVERVGGTRSIPVDIRIISATHRDLPQMVAAGQFREDLWFRLNVFPIMIPPLRQRKGDIPYLVHHFINRKSMELKLKERPTLASDAIDRLLAYDWPGNVRELENTVERALIQHRTGGHLSFGELLPLADSGGAVQAQGPDEPLISLDEINARHIRRAMKEAGGKIYGPGGAAQLLSINPNTLRKRMDKLGIAYGRKSWRPEPSD
ncbi:MAG: sigma 54-interacting transcriptional regulator [Desulfarculus sp.]|nr:sigma 54-interacting transcriptional regulator [Desulfarculus sp.]